MVFKISFRRHGRSVHDSGYALIKNREGNVYDILTLELKDKDGNHVTTFAIDIEKDGWINLFSYSDLDIKQQHPMYRLFYEAQLTDERKCNE